MCTEAADTLTNITYALHVGRIEGGAGRPFLINAHHNTLGAGTNPGEKTLEDKFFEKEVGG